MEQTLTQVDWLRIDPARECARIEQSIRHAVQRTRRKGLVLGISGGIDSSVCAALGQRALGAGRVLALMMPEADGSSESLSLGQMLGDHLGIEWIVETITPLLSACRCYERRDAAIREIFPEYGAGYKCKLVVSDTLRADSFAFPSIVIEAPDGKRHRARLGPETYRAIVAATNFKQRVRKMMEYYYADLRHFMVVGTPNRLEYDQGFFVKNGDGAADLKPIAHLYKTQVYALAEYLGIPEEIRRRPPTTDTYSLDQSQEEFYFSVPLHLFDLCLYGRNHGLDAGEVAEAAGLSSEEVRRVYQIIDRKRVMAEYLHMEPATLLDEPVPQAPMP